VSDEEKNEQEREQPGDLEAPEETAEQVKAGKPGQNKLGLKYK